MSDYATIDDIQLRLSDQYNGLYLHTDGSFMAAAAADDIASAEAEINGRIAVRYLVPLTVSLPLLKSWTLTLTEELAWSRGGHGDLPENVKRRVDYVRKCLDMVADGKLRFPGGIENTGDGAAAGGSVIVSGSPPVFGRNKMRGY